jgi:hypothetical protein
MLGPVDLNQLSVAFAVLSLLSSFSVIVTNPMSRLPLFRQKEASKSRKHEVCNCFLYLDRDHRDATAATLAKKSPLAGGYEAGLASRCQGNGRPP